MIRNNTVRKNINLFFISATWLGLSLVFMLAGTFSVSDTLLRLVAIETVIFFLMIMLNLWKAKKSFFRISTMFVLMLFLFLQGQVLLYAFGLRAMSFFLVNSIIDSY